MLNLFILCSYLLVFFVMSNKCYVHNFDYLVYPRMFRKMLLITCLLKAIPFSKRVISPSVLKTGYIPVSCTACLAKGHVAWIHFMLCGNVGGNTGGWDIASVAFSATTSRMTISFSAVVNAFLLLESQDCTDATR